MRRNEFPYTSFSFLFLSKYLTTYSARGKKETINRYFFSSFLFLGKWKAADEKSSTGYRVNSRRPPSKQISIFRYILGETGTFLVFFNLRWGNSAPRPGNQCRLLFPFFPAGGRRRRKEKSEIERDIELPASSFLPSTPPPTGY